MPLTEEQKEDLEYWNENLQNSTEISKGSCSFSQEEDGPLDNLEGYHQNSTEISKELRSFLQKQEVPEDIIERLMCFLTRIAAQETRKDKNRFYHKCLLEQTTIMLIALKDVESNISDNVLKKIPALSIQQGPLARFLFSWVVAKFVQRLLHESATTQNLELGFLTEAYVKTLGLFQRSFTRLDRCNKPVTLSKDILKSFPNLDRADKLFLVKCIEILGTSLDLTEKQLENSRITSTPLDATSWISWSRERKYWHLVDDFFFKERKNGDVRIARGKISHKEFCKKKDSVLDIAELLEGMSLDAKTSPVRRKRMLSVEEECKHNTDGNPEGYPDEDSEGNPEGNPEDDGLEKYTVRNNIDRDQLVERNIAELLGKHNACVKKTVKVVRHVSWSTPLVEVCEIPNRSSSHPRRNHRRNPRRGNVVYNRVYAYDKIPGPDSDSDSDEGIASCTIF